MSTASPVDWLANPNDATQRYTLWGNGRIDAAGGAPPITSGGAAWYDRVDQPVAVALWITNWTTGAGYLLDKSGGVHAFNGAPDLPGGVLSGVPYVAATRRYVDWAWDPAGNGQGYVLDVYGQLYAFGGATAPTRTGPRWSWPAARKLVMRFTPDKRGFTLDLYGGLQREFGMTAIGGQAPAYWPNFDAARDLVVTDFVTPSGYQLDLYGGVHGFGNNPDPKGNPYRRGADVARGLLVLSASNPLQLSEVWSGGQVWDFYSSSPPTVYAGSGTDEVQTVTITGAPTGGTFTLTYSGQTTAAIARNATAATVQTALENLSNIGVGDVAVTGGPGPATPWTVTFIGLLGHTNVAQMTATSSLTGGTTPAVTVTTATAGAQSGPAASVTDTTRPNLTWSYTDPQGDQQDAWELYAFTQTFVNGHSMTDPSVWKTSATLALSGVDPGQRGVTPTVDFPNGTYRYYVRARDTAGQWSAWANLGWTQAITPPATPTGLTAVKSATAGRWEVNLSVSATTGGSATLVSFQYSIDGTNWWPVRGADAVPLAATTTAVDRDPPLGVTVTYRAYAYANTPRVISVASNTATATVTPAVHVLTSTADPALGGEVLVIDAPSWSRPIAAGVFQPAGDPYSVVVTDGIPKSRRFPIVVDADRQSEWDKIEDLLEGNAAAGGTLVWRDPFGRVIYCHPVDSWEAVQKRLPRYSNETTPLRHNHTVSLSMVEVRAPHLISIPELEVPVP